MKRSVFIKNSAKTIAATGLFLQNPVNLFSMSKEELIDIPIGFQSYVLREEINVDISKALKKTYAMGYRHIEMCSPAGYAPHSFASLAQYSGKELIKIVNDQGFDCFSAHFTWRELTQNLDERIDFAQQMGLQHMVCSGGLDASSLNELQNKCHALNKIGEKIKKSGLILGYHNHTGEFEAVKNNRIDYEVILEELDANLIKMQFQVAAIQHGYKAADYFRKYPGRFISAHLQDYSTTVKNKEVVLGEDGIVDWVDFFNAAKIGGLKWVYVEMESAIGTLEGSLNYLKKL